jgi:DNA-directed RNA polymerase specialized sigma subunit
LEPEEVWLLNALLFERLSLRDVEYVLGIPKTTVARKRDKVLAKLRQTLEDNPYVREHIYGEST